MAWVQLDPRKPPSEQPYAFMDGDFTFLDKHCHPLNERARAKAAFVRLCWRTQKNKNNGEIKLFDVAKDDRLCPMGTAWRIQAHFECLRSVFPVLEISTEGCITASAITRVLRECASQILKVDMADAVLKLYTPH